MKLYFGVTDAHIVMNKIHSLMARYPELFEQFKENLDVKIPDPEKQISKIKHLVYTNHRNDYWNNGS